MLSFMRLQLEHLRYGDKLRLRTVRFNRETGELLEKPYKKINWVSTNYLNEVKARGGVL